MYVFQLYLVAFENKVKGFTRRLSTGIDLMIIITSEFSMFGGSWVATTLSQPVNQECCYCTITMRGLTIVRCLLNRIYSGS